MNAPFDWFEKWATYTPDKIAVEEVGCEHHYTYAQIHRASAHLAAAWSEDYRLKKGDRILVLSTFHQEYIGLLALAQKMGVILVPINYRLSQTEIDFLIRDAEPELLIIADELMHLVSSFHAKNKTLISFEAYQVQWKELANVDKSISYSSVALEESHPAFILYTSGTTGNPKGAIYTHGMMMWNSISTAMRLELTAHDRTLNVMPPFHTGGWNVLTTPILHFGGTVTLLPKFEAAQVLDLLVDKSISIFMAVPTMVRMMGECTSFSTKDFSPLRYMIVGGEALPVDLIEKWKDRDVLIRQGYGLTECGPNITSLAAEDAIRKRGSIGFPNFYVSTKLMDEHGSELVGEGRGELWIKGAIVTTGYWKNPIETAKSINEGWFRTGDIIYRDTEGYLYVVDRIKNMFISGGENVYPAQVEKVLLAHEGVSEACVVGVADEKWGEVGKAYLVGNGDTEAIKAHAMGHLAKFKVPKYFEWVTELPKNDTGKINRKILSA
ncbi:MAG: AMP-binding protein [Cyclobacteriaceae bacterium]|nr:AMP-binding protein [Cyclobacteriaceae bacterium]MCH8515348.1 AMP-binding protein [Cyclobacteriaceae bacterium]